jgi:hypothetical protein
MTGTAADDPLAQAAVANNASWCDAVAAAHGCRTRTDELAWTSATRPPALYPDAVTRSPAARPADLLARIDHGDGCAVKDSYATLDLGHHGFHVLLQGSWITRSAPVTRGRPAGWVAVGSAAALEDWEAEWAGERTTTPTFPPSLIAHPACRFLAEVRDGVVVAGAALHVSHGVVGISNLFTTSGDVLGTWAAVVAAASAFGLPLVGWESGDDLDAARQAGFDACGPLRVWVR